MKRIPPLGVSWLFVSLILFPGLAYAGQVRGYEVNRREFFTQCISNGASLDGYRGHFITAIARGATEGSLAGGTVSSRGVTWPLTNDAGLLYYNEQLTNAAAPGAYFFQVTTSEGTESRSVNLAASARKIAPARVINLEAAQSIDPNQYFELRVMPLKGGGPKDQFHLRVYHPENGLVLNSTLSAGQTSISVPAGTLAPDTTHTAYIDISHPFVIIPPRNGGAYVVASESRSTRFMLKTFNPAGEIEFVSNQYLARESDGVAAIPVRRNRSSGAVTVDYYIEGLTAQAGVNFMPTAGTLSFADGVMEQTINVPLLDDGLETGPLTARAWLTNVTGGATLPKARWSDWSIEGSAAAAPEIHAVMLAKVAFYQQTNAAVADLSDVCAPARFFASAQPLFPGAISTPQVRLPNRTMRGLVEPVQTFLEYNEDFPSRTAMDKVFRSGAYTVTVNTRSGEPNFYTLRMTREPRFAVPHLSNWAAAQQIDSTGPFDLVWDVFAGAGTDDQVAIGIRDSKGDVVFQLPEVFDAGALDASTTSYTIPANMLRPGERYHVNLTFRKVTQLKTMESGTLSCTVFAHSTGTWIETRPLAGASVFLQSAPECCGVAGLALPE